MMKKMILSVAAFLILIGAAALFLIATERGLLLLVSTSEKISKGKFKAAVVSGTLISRFALEDIELFLESGDLSVDSLEVLWGKSNVLQKKLHIRSCSLGGVQWRYSADKKEAEGPAAEYHLPEVALPMNIKIDSLTIRKLTAIENEQGIFQLDRGRISVESRDNKILIEDLFLAADTFSLNLSGAVGTSEDWPVDITGEGKINSGGKWYSLTAGVSQSLKDGKADIALLSPFEGSAKGSFSIDGVIKWSCDVILNDFDPRIYNYDTPGNISAQIQTVGEVQKGKIRAEAELINLHGELRSYPLVGGGTLQYEEGSIAISDLILKSRQSELHINGLAGSDLKIDFQIKSPDLHELYGDISGRLEGKGRISGPITGPDFSLRAAGHDVTVRSEAAVKSVEMEAKGKLSLKDTSAVLLRISDMTMGGRNITKAVLEYNGSLEKHSVGLEITERELAAELHLAGGIDGKRWHGRVSKAELAHHSRGDLQLSSPFSLEVWPTGISVNNFCLTHGASAVCAEGEFSDRKWRAEASLTAFDPAVVFPDWPGEIHAALRTQGHLLSGNIEAQINIIKLAGNLKGGQLNGSGIIKVADGQAEFDGLKLHYGEARVGINGSFGENCNISFSGEIPDLSAISQESSGQISFSGKISGSSRAPFVDVHFSAVNCRFQEGMLGELKGNVDVDFKKEGKINGEITAKKISWGDFTAQEFELKAAGSAEEHIFTLSGLSSYGNLMLQGVGDYSDGWNAEIGSASLATHGFGSWFLPGTSEIRIDSSHASVENLCVESEGFYGCFAGRYDAAQGMSGGGQITKLSLRKLNDYGLLGVTIDGIVKTDFEFSKVLNGEITFRAKGGSDKIKLSGELDDEKLESRMTSSSFSTHLQDAKLQATMESALDDGGMLQGELQIDDISFAQGEWASQPIMGKVNVLMNDLSLIALLTNSYVVPRGIMKGNLNVKGSLASPGVDGNLLLSNGNVSIPQMGITLTDVSVNIDAVPSAMNFNVTAESGPGSARGEGTLNFAAETPWSLDTHVNGSDFEILNTGDYIIRADSDIDFSCDQSGGKLSGAITIPHARIQISDKKGRVSPSKDIVIVDDGRGGVKKAWQMQTNLKLDLGDDVHVNAYGLESGLRGSLVLVDEPNKNLSAEGELELVDGRFALYSTELNIERGRLLFVGDTIDNPGVDFQAQRVVEGKVVGVNVSGSAQDLQFELFSNPMMEESNIIAYMAIGTSIQSSEGSEHGLIRSTATMLGFDEINKLTGRLGDYLSIDEIYLDGNTTSEDMSLVVGKYISKDLFVGYDYNLYDATNELRVNYKLGKGFAVETKTSVESTSGDILYTIER